MPLTPEQQKQLEELQAEQGRPEPRTDTGLAGVLHTVLDVLSGVVAHLPADAWAALHHEVEQNAGGSAEPSAADDEGQADDEAASSSSSSSSSSGPGSSSSPGKSAGKKQ